MARPPQFVDKTDHDASRHRVRNWFIRFFGGLKFGLTVLALVAVASTWGEFLPHESGMSVRLVFSTWWYRTLLALMMLNLVLNTYMTYVEETWPQYLPIFRRHPDHFNPLKVKHKAKFENVATADSKALMQSLARAFSLRGYRTYFHDDSFYAHRGLIARFGSTITHIGLITIIVGALTESFFKVDGFVQMAEGDRADFYRKEGDEKTHYPLGFEIQCRDFEFTKYPGTETASKFKSTVTINLPNQPPIHDYVRVNHDVRYGGWTFHQASYTEVKKGEWLDRYYVILNEKQPDGQKKEYRFETYVSPQERQITPLPGHNDRFFVAEDDSAQQAVVWSVASPDALLTRGKQSTMDLRIEMVRFYPDFQMDEFQAASNKSNELRNPAALIEISSNNSVEFRQWVLKTGRPTPPHAQDGESIDFVLKDVQVEPVRTASLSRSATDGLMGQIDPAHAPASTAVGGALEERAVVTVELQHQGAGTGRTYTLRKGESVRMTGEPDRSMDIGGNYELAGFRSIPTYVTTLSVSKNPGIPIVWIGAIFATFGPFLAFFVSRRRVWAYVDWSKKTIWFGGESRYTREALEDEVAEVLTEWSKSDEAGLKPPINLAVPTDRPKLSLSL